MVKRYYNLPSLTALAVFEASARHQSFKLAAVELNVTTGAVSRQIKAVEDEIGLALFTRRSTGVDLTSAGEELYGVLSQSFGRTAETVARLKQGTRAPRVTLACSNAMATMWLFQRMASFWNAHPDIVVDHLISDQPRDYRRADVQLRIRYGAGAWPDETAVLLFHEEIYPVCSPRFAEKHTSTAPNDLPHLPLLHVDWVDPDWTDWDEFLRRAEVAHGPLAGGRISNFAATMQACQDGRGLAVGWHHLVKPLIEAGKLVRFGTTRISAPGAYYLTWNDRRELSPAALALKSWLLHQASAEK